MSKERRVYTLNGLPPEVVAVAFAKTSRSPESFDAIARELTEAKSSEFHEKWVVGYGHSSVAEHAVLSIAVENVSRLAIEVIEANRLASYTEKSSRYQLFERDDYFKPSNVLNSGLAGEYVEATNALYDAYYSIAGKLTDYSKQETPITSTEKPWAYETRMKVKAIDCARFLLPCSAYANVGVTINARSLEHALVKMFSHPLQEVREVAGEIKRECVKVTPALLKYTNPSKYLIDAEKRLNAKTVLRESSDSGYDVKLVDCDENAVNKIVAALMYKAGSASFLECMKKTSELDNEEKNSWLEAALNDLGKHDAAIRELEHVQYTFDCLMDQGAYYEFKRHRMCTQTPQYPTIEWGFVIPREVINAGLRNEYVQAIATAEKTHRSIAREFPLEAAYLVTNAHKRRVLASMNLRECYNFIRLRAGKNAHFTIRPIAFKMLELLKEKHPQLVKHLVTDTP